MPNDILAFILSMLPIREAARTSILSGRWRYVWKASVALSAINLDVLEKRGSSYPKNFFGIFGEFGFTDNMQLVSDERLKFVDWVDMILNLDLARVADSFWICYYFRKEEFAHLIDEWISIAISKKVKNYDINLSHFDSWGNMQVPSNEFYEFPNRLFTQETLLLLKSLSLHSCVFKPLDSNAYTSLLELKFKDVFLDQICNLVVCGSLHKLKHLAIFWCRGLICVEIDAKNLLRFEFIGCGTKFIFRSVPKLLSVSFDCNDHNATKNLSATLENFSSNLPKLESLMLTLLPVTENLISTNFVNLTKLELMIETFEDGQALWSYIPLIQSSPNLLRLELNWVFSRGPAAITFVKPMPLESPHRCLEEIKLSGFTGTNHEIEFASYLITNTNALATITISCNLMWYYWDTNMEGYYECNGFGGHMDKNKIGKANQQLMDVVPTGALLRFI